MKRIGYPDLSLPRYRKPLGNIITKEYLNTLREELPSCSYLSDAELRKIINVFNSEIWNTVIETRDGVELPEQIGHIFIGTCPQNQKKKNVNYIITRQYMKVIQHRNWESDNYLAKIFFSTFGSKYRFLNHELWGFEPCRKFKRTVSKTYPIKWKMYLEIDPLKKISNIYNNQMYHIKREEEGKNMLENYNEFEL
jgi:hypothetical protein